MIFTQQQNDVIITLSHSLKKANQREPIRVRHRECLKSKYISLDDFSTSFSDNPSWNMLLYSSSSHLNQGQGPSERGDISRLCSIKVCHVSFSSRLIMKHVIEHVGDLWWPPLKRNIDCFLTFHSTGQTLPTVWRINIRLSCPTERHTILLTEYDRRVKVNSGRGV